METVPTTRLGGTGGGGSRGGARQNSAETYREEREQHPGGNHDLTLPQRQPDLENQPLLKLRPGSPFLGRTPDVEDAALCQVTAFQVKWDRAGIPWAQGPGGRRPRKHTDCNVNRPDFSDSKVHFGTALEPSRANETGVECIYFYTATNYQITFYQINYDPTNASC